MTAPLTKQGGLTWGQIVAKMRGLYFPICPICLKSELAFRGGNAETASIRFECKACGWESVVPLLHVKKEVQS